MPVSGETRAVTVQDLLQDAGFMIRMTEWHDGFQCCAFFRTDVRIGAVTAWMKTEREAWLELHRILEPKLTEMTKGSTP
jgi:hypothetical protein